MVVDYDSFSQELKNETYEYLYDSGCYDCIYGVIDDYILNSVAGAVLNDCV